MGGLTLSSPSVISAASGTIDIFIKEMDNQILRKTYNSSGWSPNSNWNLNGKKLENGKLSACAAYSAGRIDFVTLDSK